MGSHRVTVRPYTPNSSPISAAIYLSWTAHCLSPSFLPVSAFVRSPMENLRKAVNEIAYAHDHAKLSPLHRSILPVLSLASSLYSLALSLRRSLYRLRLFRRHRFARFIPRSPSSVWMPRKRRKTSQSCVLASIRFSKLLLLTFLGENI